MAGQTGYVHGTDPREQQRLSTLNDLINDACLRELTLCRGDRILDVGCGLGQFTRAMARAAGPGAFVLGIERSHEQLTQAKQQAEAACEAPLVEFRQGDALRLPLHDRERGTFDLVHTRFLLEHVPDPLAVVREMVQAARPGGRIVLADDDHDVLRLWPAPPGLAEVWHAYMRLYDRMGNDPIVGRRLVWLLHHAGAKPVRNAWPFFGCCAGHPHFDMYVENLIGVLNTARERMIDQRLLEAAQFDAAIDELRRWKIRPDAAIWFAIAWAEGARVA